MKLLALVAVVGASGVRPFVKRGDGHVLSPGHLASLERGSTVIMHGAGRGRGTAVADVAAPPGTVWRTFLSFDRYPGKYPNCVSTNVYSRQRSGLTETIGVELGLGLGFGLNLRTCCIYNRRAIDRILTWSLDPGRKSDFEALHGQFVVEPHPSKGPGWSRVWYSTDVVLPAWLPKFIATQIPKQSGTKTLAFVKSEAEASYRSLRASYLPRLPRVLGF